MLGAIPSAYFCRLEHAPCPLMAAVRFCRLGKRTTRNYCFLSVNVKTSHPEATQIYESLGAIPSAFLQAGSCTLLPDCRSSFLQAGKMHSCNRLRLQVWL